MITTRAEALEHELQDTKKAYDNEREAHTATKQEVVELWIRLRDLERVHKATEEKTQLWILKSLLEGEAGSNGEMGKVYTDDKELRAILPDPPVHPPERYGARSLPSFLDLNGSSPPSPDVDDTLGRRSKGLEDQATKRSFDDMGADESNDALIALRKPGNQRVVVCIRCYQHKLRCDPGEPCRNCVTAKHMCRRAKCNDYKTGKCRRVSCLRAHQMDEEVCDNLVHAKHVPRTDPSKPIMHKAKKQRKDDDDDDGKKGGSGNPRSGGTGIGVAL